MFIYGNQWKQKAYCFNFFDLNFEDISTQDSTHHRRRHMHVSSVKVWMKIKWVEILDTARIVIIIIIIIVLKPLNSRVQQEKREWNCFSFNCKYNVHTFYLHFVFHFISFDSTCSLSIGMQVIQLRSQQILICLVVFPFLILHMPTSFFP